MRRHNRFSRHVRQLLAAILLTVGAAGCGLSAQPTPTLAPQGPPLTLAAQVDSVSASTRTITIPRTAQGFTTVVVADAATISDTNSNVVSLENVRPGMLIQISGQTTTAGALLANEVRVLTPSAAPTLATEAVLAEETIKKFISALSIDPSGSTSVKYLSRAQQAQAQSGTPVPLLAGIRLPVPSFNVAMMEPATNPNQITFRVTLNYASPVDRLFMLVKEDGAWKIERITSG
ncbi:MAG: hypothetical protein HY782_09100 [Chloroflexi bacterium]|nr:hypothetical protein [Chloroflexota bacterium]